MHGSQHDNVQLIDAVPARCAQLLSAGEVDAALVPIIEYQRLNDVSVVPGVCVGAKDEVRSVVLVSTRNELKSIRTVALDESSRTSATLVKVIFREFLGFEPQWTTSMPDLQRMLNENDAALIIGDPGMTFPREGLRVWDMAGLWREHTGLGFVFAMWMVRNNALDNLTGCDFSSARDEGLARAEEIVSHYEKLLPLSREEIRAYLTDNIVFQIDESMEKGLQSYFELAGKHGLIESVKPLHFAEHLVERQ